jgi:hypothetical protein
MPIRLPAVAKAEWALDVPTQPWQRLVTIWAYNPEAENTIYRAPDDERCTARNMLSL